MKTSIPTPPAFSRRKFVQIVAIAGGAAALWQFGVKQNFSGYHTVRQGRSLMGTTLNLIVIGPDRDAAQKALHSSFAKMEALEKRLSRYRPDSELSLLNRTGSLAEAGSDIRTLLQLAQSISRETGGAFDVTILPLLALYRQSKELKTLPTRSDVTAALRLVNYQDLKIDGSQVTLARPGMGITLDGIGKGYVVDQGVATLKKHGFPNVFVEAGGDLMASGSKAQGRPWRIGIKNPRPGVNRKMTSLEATDIAVATSGDYMQAYTDDLRHHHIINPATGFSPPELASATVAAPSAALADGLATATMVLGAEKSLALLESLPGCEGYFISKDLSHFQTSGFFG